MSPGSGSNRSLIKRKDRNTDSYLPWRLTRFKRLDVYTHARATRHRQGREGLKALSHPGLRNNLHSIPDTHPVSRFGVRGTRHKRVESQHDWLHAGIVNFSPCLLLYGCSNLISEIVKRKTKCHHHVWHVTAQRRLHVCNPDWIQMIYSRWWDTLKIENRLFLHPTFYSRKDSERTR